ncbi:MAG: SET domain-containing protein [Myxococcales bacterium]|nr:SET domain-containing protein [Myxococcales bacterium]
MTAADLDGDVVDRRAPTPAVNEPGWAPLPARAVATPTAAERATAVARVLAWATEAGAEIDGVELHVDARGDGSVRAARAIAAGQTLVMIPRRLMIVSDELAASATGATDLGVDAHSPCDALAAWLPQEARRTDSPWRHFLGALPAHLAELPMFHGDDDLAPLAGTAARRLAADLHRDVVDTYAALPPELRARVPLADFAWGRAIVASRGFNAPFSLDDRLAFIPVVDLFNHGHGDTTWHYDPVTERYQVRAARDIAAGAEVHFAYGAKSNAKLLASYGFALAENPAGEALLEFATMPDVGRSARRPWAPLPAASVVVGAEPDDRFLRALSSARRLAAADDGRGRADDDDHDDVPWLGAEVERAALDTLSNAARRSRARLTALDAAPSNSAWHRACALVRAGERAVLAQLIEFVALATPHLADPTPAALRAAAAALSPAGGAAHTLARAYLDALADALTTARAPHAR